MVCIDRADGQVGAGEEDHCRLHEGRGGGRGQPQQDDACVTALAGAGVRFAQRRRTMTCCATAGAKSASATPPPTPRDFGVTVSFKRPCASCSCTAAGGSRKDGTGDGVVGLGRGAAGREMTYRLMFLACATQARPGRAGRVQHEGPKQRMRCCTACCLGLHAKQLHLLLMAMCCCVAKPGPAHGKHAPMSGHNAHVFG